MRFNCLILLVFITKMGFAQTRAYPFSKNHIGGYVSIYSDKTFPVHHLELKSDQNGIASIDHITVGGSAGDIFYQRTFPFRSGAGKWVNQLGILISPTEYFTGSGNDYQDHKYTIDSLVYGSSGQKIPLDSMVKSVRNNSIESSIIRLGLTYSITDIRKERWVFSYGIACSYAYAANAELKTHSYDLVSYSPDVHPSELIHSNNNDEYVKLKMQLFYASMPITAMILINENQMKKDTNSMVNRCFGGVPYYFGLQLNPMYRFGKLPGDNRFHSFDLYLSFKLVIGFDKADLKSPKRKEAEAIRKRNKIRK